MWNHSEEEKELVEACYIKWTLKLLLICYPCLYCLVWYEISLTQILSSVIVEWCAVWLGRMIMLEQDVTSLQLDLTALCMGGRSTRLKKEKIKLILFVLSIQIYVYLCMMYTYISIYQYMYIDIYLCISICVYQVTWNVCMPKRQCS